MIRISESVHHNEEVHIEEISDHGQESGDQASHHVPPIPSKLANKIGDPNYWLPLVAESMKQIPQVLTETPPKEDKLADSVAWLNPKVYDGTYDPVVLEELIRGM